MRKAFFKLFIKLHTFLYKLTGGNFGGKMGQNQILLLTTKGRRSGQEFTTPLVYMDHEDGYLIIASNGGNSNHPQWYLNLKSESRVTLQIKDRTLSARAEILDGPTRAPIWESVVAQAPQYGEYEKRTERLIPVVRLRTEGE